MAIGMRKGALLHQDEGKIFKDFAELMKTLNINIGVCYGIAYRIVNGSVSSDLYLQIDKLLNTMDKISENIKTFQPMLPKLL